LGHLAVSRIGGENKALHDAVLAVRDRITSWLYRPKPKTALSD
jgi:hypothetical protein